MISNTSWFLCVINASYESKQRHFDEDLIFLDD